MLEALSEWLALALSLIPLVLLTCNKNNKTKSVRQRGGGNADRSSRREVVINLSVEATQNEDDLRICDSLREARVQNTKSKSTSGRGVAKPESDSSFTDLIVVPLGKAKTATVTRNNLTKRSERKRDQSSGTGKQNSQKKVQFKDGKSSRRMSRERDFKEEVIDKSSSLT